MNTNKQIKEQLDLLKGKLSYMFSIDRISAYQYGQLERYFEERADNLKPYLNMKKQENEEVADVAERLIKEITR